MKSDTCWYPLRKAGAGEQSHSYTNDIFFFLSFLLSLAAFVLVRPNRADSGPPGAGFARAGTDEAKQAYAHGVRGRGQVFPFASALP